MRSTICPHDLGVSDDPILHYLEYGWKEGRNPSPGFDTLFYWSSNPDVRSSVINPCLHCWIARAGSINHLFVGLQRAVSPDRPEHLPSACHAGSPISVESGVTPPNSSQRRPRRRAFALPACFPASRRPGLAADATARTRSLGLTPSGQTARAAVALGTVAASGLRAKPSSHPGG